MSSGSSGLNPLGVILARSGTLAPIGHRSFEDFGVVLSETLRAVDVYELHFAKTVVVISIRLPRGLDDRRLIPLGYEMNLPDRSRAIAGPSEYSWQKSWIVGRRASDHTTSNRRRKATGENRCPGRSTRGLGNVAILEQHTRLGHTVDIGSIADFVTVAAESVGSELIGEDQHDVESRCGSRFSFGFEHRLGFQYGFRF